MKDSFILKGNICWSQNPTTINTMENGYLICVDGISEGVFATIPEHYQNLPVLDQKNRLIIPGMVDLHVHAPQLTFAGLGMDLELLEWLEQHTFPEESKYQELDYARQGYSHFVKELRKSPNTRSCIFATIHSPATLLLMDLLEESGLITLVGKVNMDRNSPPYLVERSCEKSIQDSIEWIEISQEKYKRTKPILTPRFIPSCSDSLMNGLFQLQQKYHLPVQSHLSENPEEVAWVRELCPQSSSYSNAYQQFGLFGGEVPTIMAHGVWLCEEEIQLMAQRQVFLAHCPQSNLNLSSGIAPIRKMLNHKVPIGLGSDVAGGANLSIFRAITDAIAASKLYWRYLDQKDTPLSFAEAFYLGTLGGGAFFGKVGTFNTGYELDALVIDDETINSNSTFNLLERLTRVVYFSTNENIVDKYVAGKHISVLS